MRWATEPRWRSSGCRCLAISGYPCRRARDNLDGSRPGTDGGPRDPPTGDRRTDAVRGQGTGGLTASTAMTAVTRILLDIERGDPKAGEQVLPLVYGELRTLPAHRLSLEKPGQTLQAPALVHE